MFEEAQGRVCTASVQSGGDGNKSLGGQADAVNFQMRLQIEARFLGSCLMSPSACVQNDNFLSGRIQSVPEVCSHL